MTTEQKVFSGHQPNFIPYMGFFYKMFQSDIFIIDDDVQFTSNDWTNRNYLKIGGQKHLVTVPVSYEFGDPINSVRIHRDDRWERKFFRSLETSYGKAPFYDLGYSLIQRHMDGCNGSLSDMNIGLIREIADCLGLRCKIVVASEILPTELTGNDRNIYQCTSLGCNVYYSGTGGRAYNDESAYAAEGIELVYSDYEEEPYRQQGRSFLPNLSVLDYIFNQGFQIPSGWRRMERQ